MTANLHSENHPGTKLPLLEPPARPTTAQMDKLWELLLSGVSGWLLILLGRRWYKSRTSVKQSDIEAGGNVAGGTIHRGAGATESKPAQEVTQERISADGDVAGGDIVIKDK